MFGNSKGTVVLFCSDSDVLAVLQGALEEDGYVVLTAKTLDTAVRRLEEDKADLLIVRPYLEELSGHEAAVYLRTKSPGIPVLMVGGMPDDDRVVDREAVSDVEIFPRPFPVADMLKKVAAMLASASQEQG